MVLVDVSEAWILVRPGSVVYALCFVPDLRMIAVGPDVSSKALVVSTVRRVVQRTEYSELRPAPWSALLARKMEGSA